MPDRCAAAGRGVHARHPQALSRPQTRGELRQVKFSAITCDPPGLHVGRNPGILRDSPDNNTDKRIRIEGVRR